MRSLWLRLYVDLPNSLKIHSLPDATFRFWIYLLCLTKEYQNDGLIPSKEDLAFKMRISKEEVEKQLQELRSRGLLDKTDDGEEPHNWQELQPRSDSDPTALTRKRRQRAREKEGKPAVPPPINGAASDVTGDGHGKSPVQSRVEYINNREEKSAEEGGDRPLAPFVMGGQASHAEVGKPMGKMMAHILANLTGGKR